MPADVQQRIRCVRGYLALPVPILPSFHVLHPSMPSKQLPKRRLRASCQLGYGSLSSLALAALDLRDVGHAEVGWLRLGFVVR